MGHKGNLPVRRADSHLCSLTIISPKEINFKQVPWNLLELCLSALDCLYLILDKPLISTNALRSRNSIPYLAEAMKKPNL
ncbi:hypothetical protein TNIN_360221 [Trichonephila inaurata madagascariensis]|uniref:Uncharacterized protein n=1 Tax=Trichonephila inaurata madagascariensis TaxID=2747483 RepID=A0A8X6WQ63_9ARAC|nr:hypothetical protein TNIN_360221 [Trichonephila inaurata madagascariensis]